MAFGLKKFKMTVNYDKSRGKIRTVQNQSLARKDRVTAKGQENLDKGLPVQPVTDTQFSKATGKPKRRKKRGK